MLTTIVFFVLGLIASYFIAVWQMKKNKIIHFSINSYDIGKGLSDEFPEFKLHFGDEALADNVMVLKGGFMNTGKKDINGLKGENDIKLILPDECTIKAFTISSSTEDLMVTANKDNEKDNILNFGISEILKEDEYFKYTVIIETSGEIDNLHDRLKFQHRILNTDKIRDRYIGQQKSLYRKKLYKMMVASSVLLVLLLIILSLYQKVSFKIYQNSTDKEVSLFIDAKSNLYIDDGIAIPFISGTMVSKGDLNNNYRIVPVTEYKWNNPTLIVAMVETLMLIFFVGLFYFLFGGNSHIINVIRENEKNKKDQ